MPDNNELADVLNDLAALIAERRGGDAAASYTAGLLQGDEDALLKKIVEEAGETVLAAKGGDPERLSSELADLWFHCLIVMTRYNVGLSDVAATLAKRRGVSGLAEKAARRQQTE